MQSDRNAAAVNVPVKPTIRSRPTSANSFNPPVASSSSSASAATNAAFGRLRIDSSQPAAVTRAATQAAAAAAAVASTAVAAVKPRRAPTRAPAQPAAVAPSAPRIEQGEWAGANANAGYAPPAARSEHGAVAPVGLGIEGVGAPSAMAAGHKRSHDVEFSDDEAADHGAEAAQAFGPQAHGHAHPHGSIRHEDKVRVIDASGQEQEAADDPDDWLMQLCDPEEAEDSEYLIAEIKREFQEEIDYFDISMVAEYSEDVFKYMAELEVSSREVGSGLCSPWLTRLLEFNRNRRCRTLATWTTRARSSGRCGRL